MSITIHPELEAMLRTRAEAEGITVEAYVERIARDDEQAHWPSKVLTRANRLKPVRGIGQTHGVGSFSDTRRRISGENSSRG